MFEIKWCDEPASHNHLFRSLMLFALTAENAEPPVFFTHDEPMLSPLNFSFQLIVSNNSFSDRKPSHNENNCSFLCCFWLTSWSHLVYSTWFFRQRLRLREWCLCHECTWLCRCRRCLPPVFHRKQFPKQTVHLSLVVIKRLPDVAKLLVLRS